MAKPNIININKEDTETVFSAAFVIFMFISFDELDFIQIGATIFFYLLKIGVTAHQSGTVSPRGKPTR